MIKKLYTLLILATLSAPLLAQTMGNSCDGVLFAPKKGQWQISVLLGGGNNFYNENTSYLLPKFSHNGKPGNGDNGTVGLPNDDKDNAQNGDLSAYLNIDGLNNNSLTNILGIEGKYFLSDCWDINFQFSMNINLTPKKDYVEGDYEDRPQFADHARNAGATEVICQPFEDALDQIEGDKDTYFVVLTRGHRYDQVCLEKIVGKEHAYIGMIGSRRRSAMVKQNLIEKGCSQEVIGEIKSPIGLNIGAETPEEIGVAIMAEIIEVKNQNKRVCGYPKDLLEAILDIVHPGKKMLATIITRKGSAPRNVGSKMLILEDGSCVGTIGGGCMEAEVLRKARVMMHENNTGLKTEYVDMTGDDAEEEGMVCGGTIEVLLEPLWN